MSVEIEERKKSSFSELGSGQEDNMAHKVIGE